MFFWFIDTVCQWFNRIGHIYYWEIMPQLETGT